MTQLGDLARRFINELNEPVRPIDTLDGVTRERVTNLIREIPCCGLRGNFVPDTLQDVLYERVIRDKC